jgi:anti-anti-sigma factor
MYPKIKVCSHRLEVIIPETLTLTVSLRGSREVKDTYQLIRLTGLLDAFSEPAFKKVIGKCVEDGPVNVILDLSTIDFVDSSGLGVLVQMAKKTQGLSGTLQIITNPRVTQTVKLVRLDQFLSLQASIDEALAKLDQPKKS